MDEFEQLVKSVDEYMFARSVYRKNKDYGVDAAVAQRDADDIAKAFLNLKARFDKYVGGIQLTKQ